MNRDREIRRSARALFDIAAAGARLDAVHGDLCALRAAVETEPALTAGLADYGLPDDARRALVAALLATGPDPLTAEFLRRMEQHKLLGRLPALAGAFAEFHEKRKGILRVRLTAAAPMDEARVGTILERLAGLYRQAVVPQVDHDPALLAGFRVRAGDTVHDFTAAARLARIRRAWSVA